MNFGHNSNVQVGETVYHVQTEERGAEHPFIDTTVYFSGRVLHRRTTSYYDLLEMEGDREPILKQRVDEQHRAVLDEIRSGALKLAPPSSALTPKEAPARAPAEKAEPAGVAGRLRLELLNPTSWFAAGKAVLQVAVCSRETGAPLPGIEVEARIEGAAAPARFETRTDEMGRAELEFAMPRVGPEGGALVLRATVGDAFDQLRFQLKAKPRSPSAAGVR